MNVQELIEYLQKLVATEPEAATLLVTNPIEYDANNTLNDVTVEEEKEGELETVFENGLLVRDQTFEEVRNLIWK